MTSTIFSPPRYDSAINHLLFFLCTWKDMSLVHMRLKMVPFTNLVTYVWLDMRVIVITSLQAGHLGVSEGDEGVKGHRDPTTQ